MNSDYEEQYSSTKYKGYKTASIEELPTTSSIRSTGSYRSTTTKRTKHKFRTADSVSSVNRMSKTKRTPAKPKYQSSTKGSPISQRDLMSPKSGVIATSTQNESAI